MFQSLISWRRNLFMLMLMLLFLYSFTSHSKQLCCGWQFENRHISGKGFQVIRCSVPVQCGYFQFLFRQISFAIGKRLIMSSRPVSSSKQIVKCLRLRLAARGYYIS